MLGDIPQQHTDRRHMLIQEVLKRTQKNILYSSSELYGVCQHL